MRTRILFLLATFCCATFLRAADPEIITQWTFEGDVTTPSTGSGTATNIGGTSSAFATGNGGGRGWNTSAYPNQSENSGTAGIQLSINTSGYEDITLAFDHRASGTASRWAQIDYSLNGGASWETGFWNNNGGLSPHDTFYSFDVDFSSINGANNNAQFVVRIVSIFSPDEFNPVVPSQTYAADTAYHRARVSGGSAYGSAGTWRFDNITFSGVQFAPPPTIADAVWNQPGSGVWDTTTANWSGGDPVGNLFKDGDNATFSNENGGAISITGDGVQVNNWTVNADAGTYTFTGGPVAGGSLIKQGNGVAVLESPNSFTGGTTISGGELHISDDNQLGLAGTGVNINGGQLTLLGSVTSGRSIGIGASGAILDTGDFSATFSAITGAGGLDKFGTGDLTLTGWNVSGPTTLQEGNLILQLIPNTYSFGAGGTMDGNLILAGAFRLNFGAGSIDGNGSIQVLQSGASLANTGSGLNTVLEVDIVLNPDGNAGAFLTNIGTTSGNTMVIDGLVSGDSDVQFSAGPSGGAGVLALNQQNSYTGQTLINNAQSGVIRLGVENALPTTTGVTWGISQNSGSIDLNGFDQTLAYIATDSFFTGGVANTGAAAILTLQQDIDTVFAASIGQVSHQANLPDANDLIQLVKEGDGTLTLSGANTHADGTIIRSGGIIAENNSALGTGPVTVEAGTLMVANGVLLSLDPASDVVLAAEAALFRKEFLFDGFVSEPFSNFGTVTGDFGVSPRTSVSFLGGQDDVGGLAAELSFTDVNPALNGAAPASLIANITGLDNQLFVLQLGLDVPISAGWYLGWHDPVAGAWTNAIEGNYLDPDTIYTYSGYAGDIAFADFLAANGGELTTAFLGAWGIDVATYSVWAVLNHNSEFAAIPEPSAILLVGLGLGLLALRRHMRPAPGATS